jgi:hypothetical protein
VGRMHGTVPTDDTVKAPLNRLDTVLVH